MWQACVFVNISAPRLSPFTLPKKLYFFFSLFIAACVLMQKAYVQSMFNRVAIGLATC